MASTERTTVVRRELRISLGDRGAVSGILTQPSRGGEVAVVLGHGAGGNLHNTVVAAVAHGLASRGYACLRYNFPFSEAGRRRPDFPRLLQSATMASADRARAETGARAVVLAGKSLGGRMSSHCVADHGYDAAALVFLGYPLHPPRREDELRDAHLSRIACPMLFVEGTRDPYANLGLLRPVVDRVLAEGGHADVHVIDGADHDFRVPVRSGRTHAEVIDEIVGVVGEWIGRLTSV